MVEDVKNVYERNPKMTDLARELSIISKNIGNVGFSVKYPATESNIGIHERFIRFAFDEANGDYIVAIGKLLDYAELGTRIDSIEQRLQMLEVMVLDHFEDNKKVEEPKEFIKKDLKTF